MEEFFLGALGASDELNIVDHQHVHVAETVAEGRHALEADGGDHFIGEFLGADVGEAQRGIAALERVADGLHQVRLAESHAAVQEQRIVGFRWLLGDGDGRGVGELVRRADNEFVEGVARVQLARGRIEIELLLRRDRRRSQRCFAFDRDEFQDQARSADFNQHGLQKLAVGFGKALAEEPCGNADDQQVLFRALLPGWFEPGGVAMWIYAPRGMLQDFVPEIHLEIQPSSNFHNGGNAVESLSGREEASTIRIFSAPSRWNRARFQWHYATIDV